MQILLVLALASAAFAASVDLPADPYPNPQRIIGGSVTTITQWPSMVALLFSWTTSGHRQSCGGAILTQRSIMTAAHCTVNHPEWRWRIRAGSTYANSGGVTINAARMINHPQYNSLASYDADISIVHLANLLGFNNNIRPANIAGSNYNLGDNQVVWATGWGTTSPGGSLSEQLRQVQIWTVNQATCRNRYATRGYTITNNMLCSGWLDVGGRDQCQGDSGGPLYHNTVVVGVCSWGLGCADPFFPGVNARVSSYTSWIQSNA